MSPCSAEPLILHRRELHHVLQPDFLDLTELTLCPTAIGRLDQRLPDADQRYGATGTNPKAIGTTDTGGSVPSKSGPIL